jgi:enamine deaminase RidA (YjgF/YER057c/UK114 family)
MLPKQIVILHEAKNPSSIARALQLDAIAPEPTERFFAELKKSSQPASSVKFIHRKSLWVAASAATFRVCEKGLQPLKPCEVALAIQSGCVENSRSGWSATQNGATPWSDKCLHGRKKLERKITNPWKWQDALGFVQGHEVSGGQHVLYCAGQISVDADGKTLHAGDYRGQLNKTLDNLEQVLTSAGFTFADVVRLNFYTTDLDGFFANRAVILERVVGAGARYTSTLLGVARLARPEWLIEIEATAVR